MSFFFNKYQLNEVNFIKDDCFLLEKHLQFTLETLLRINTTYLI